MDISVIIPTRGRVAGLSTIIDSMSILESGKHRVTYGVCCDDDDPQTIDWIYRNSNRRRILPFIGPRPYSLGDLINRTALRMKAPVYTAVCDDALCVTPHWDAVIATYTEQCPYGVFWWNNALAKPGNEAYWAIVTEQWRAAAGGIFTDHYPYWFDDLALMEMWLFVTDQPNLSLDICLADAPATTHRMRELKFWRNFYVETRKLRVKQAVEITKKLGLPALTAKRMQELDEGIGGALANRSDAEIRQIELQQGDSGLPDENYKKAKARAEKILAELV